MTDLAKGPLEGRNGHVMTGRFRIDHQDVKTTLHLDDAFTFNGAPAPWWGFGRAGEEFDRHTRFAELTSNEGAQSVPVPPSLDISSCDRLIPWCRQVDVLLGEGSLEA